VLQFKLDATFASGGAFQSRSNSYTPITGTEDPWLFASAARGLTRCAIPLLGLGDGLAVYRVKLGFADPDNDRPGVRVFDVKLQGKTVLAGFDIAAAAGGRDKAVFREFSGVEVADKLDIELVAKSGKPAPQQAPILQAVEVVREKVLKLGCALPSFLLSTMEPRQSAAVQLANLREEDFEGTAEVLAPEGFTVSAEPNTSGVSKTSEASTRAGVPIRLAAKSRSDILLQLCLTGDVAAGKYPLRLRVLRPDGTAELEASTTIEHLGRRARMVVKAVADAHVQKRYPETNRGSAAVLLVDGGDTTMGDLDHAMAYLKFRFTVPGKVLGVRLRIRNAGNPSGDCGRLCLVSSPWWEEQISYAKRPALGAEVGRLGAATENQLIERPLTLDLQGRTEVSLAIDPTSNDGVDFHSREGAFPPELVIDYEPEK
jgi:hypothetical protein